MGAALRELGDHTACPLVVSGSVDGPVPLAVGMAIYQLVSEVSQMVSVDSPLAVHLGGGGTEQARVTITAAPMVDAPGNVRAELRTWAIIVGGTRVMRSPEASRSRSSRPGQVAAVLDAGHRDRRSRSTPWPWPARCSGGARPAHRPTRRPRPRGGRPPDQQAALAPVRTRPALGPRPPRWAGTAPTTRSNNGSAGRSGQTPGTASNPPEDTSSAAVRMITHR